MAERNSQFSKGTERHLDRWLATNVSTEHIDSLKDAMVKVFCEDPAYWENQSWLSLLERTGCYPCYR